MDEAFKDAVGLALVDGPDTFKLLFRLLLDLAFASLLVRGVYTRREVPDTHAFTCFMFNVITFLVCFLLRKVPIELGFALGLFAVFGILRYRTEAMRARDLTYLFVAIGVAMLNAIANKRVSLSELLVVNLGIIAIAAYLERAQGPVLQARRVVYDDMEALRAHDESALVDDLRERTGLPIVRAEVIEWNLLRDTAEVRIYYRAHEA